MLYNDENPKKVDSVEDIKQLKHCEYYEFTCECGISFKKRFNKYKDIFSQTHCKGCCVKKFYKENPDYVTKRTEKTKQTLISKYGSLEKAYETRQEKIEKTNLDRYGVRVPNAFGSKEFKENMIQKYGTSNISSVEEIKEKVKQTCIQKYGYDNCMKNDAIKEKVKQTNISRYGCMSSQLPENREKVSKANKENASERMRKSIETCKERYGVKYIFQAGSFREKTKEIIQEKYGVEYYSQSDDYNHKRRKKYLYDSIYFDSTIEVAYYIMLKENNIPFEYQPKIKIKYYDKNNRERLYKPDFIVRGELVELKGDHLMKGDWLYSPYTKKILIEKTECLRQNNVKIIKYSELIDLLKKVLLERGKDFFKNIMVLP